VSTPLEFGIILGDVPIAIDPREHLDFLLRQVETAQRCGFTTICIGQHFLYSEYRWLQPIPLLARLAAETDAHVKLAPTVLIVPAYHPVILAEELATLDILCGGRLIVGVGTGYRAAEFDYLGIPYGERYRRLEEALALMQRLWTEDVVSFEGEFWQLQEAPTHLHPLQQPRPPLWMGAMKAPGIRRAARLADGWMISPQTSSSEVVEGMAVFDAERTRLGLDLPRLPIRREIVIGRDLDDALRIFGERTRERYLAYAAREHPLLSSDGFDEGFRQWALDRAILGSPDDCVEALRRLDSARLGPVVIRPGWPGQSPDEAIANLEQLGEQVVSSFRALSRSIH
jgi:alkanesulfonate monooxygenase SsuD/methylene tetrahydromethanopterin reductase-like flavin-dependent oxidoreductase (luciferase family)